MSLRSLLIFFVPLLAFGCTAATEPVPVPPDFGPCADAWGPEPAGGRLYVDPGAAPGGAGTFADPSSDIAGALELVAAGGARSIAIAAGELPSLISLNASLDPWLVGGLEIAGCGIGQTVLTETVADGSVPDIPAGTVQSILVVANGATADVTVRDLTMLGGWRTVTIRNGAGASGAIVLQRVRVEGATRLGVLVDGVFTLARLEEVEVAGVADDEGEFGYGVSFQIGAPIGSDLSTPNQLQDVIVEDCVGVGILVDGGHVDMLGAEVRGTAPVGGALGRGVQIQNRSYGTLSELLVENNADAAVFLRRPGRAEGPVAVSSSELRSTSPADVPDGATSGDGLVLLGLDDVVAEQYVVVIDDLSFAGNPRSHVLVDGALLQMEGEPLFGKGTSFPLAAQAGGLVQSLDGGAPPVEPQELSDDEALSLQEESMALDLLGR